MRCPHCNIAIHEGWSQTRVCEYPRLISSDPGMVPSVIWLAFHQRCPECYGGIIYLQCLVEGTLKERFMAYPNAPSRPVRSDRPVQTGFQGSIQSASVEC